MTKPLFVGQQNIGEQYSGPGLFVFFGNRFFHQSEFDRIFAFWQLRHLRQTHSAKVQELKIDEPTDQLKADALITDQFDVAVGIYTADCMPILIHDPASGLIAAVHAGWRGVVQRILPHTLEKMKITETKNLKVWMGPHIQRASFEVHEDVASQLLNSTQEKNREQILFSHPRDPKKQFVDLKKIAMLQLQEFEIPSKNIFESSIDTFTNLDYYSYRRQGPTGRLISFIVRTTVH